MSTEETNQQKLSSAQRLKEKEVAVITRIQATRKGVFDRFPLLFTMLGAFGVVATFYGFEGIINKIDVLADNPFIILATGVITLIITGTLYKKLG